MDIEGLLDLGLGQQGTQLAVRRRGPATNVLKEIVPYDRDHRFVISGSVGDHRRAHLLCVMLRVSVGSGLKPLDGTIAASGGDCVSALPLVREVQYCGISTARGEEPRRHRDILLERRPDR